MAEIKSTLELVMERTRGMAVSEDEKREMKRKEIFQKETGLSNRYREGLISSNEVLKEIEKMEEQTGAEIRKILLANWIAALSLNDEGERLLEGIQALKDRRLEPMEEKFGKLLNEYRREKDQRRQEAETLMTERLRREGIGGSAVVPNPERSDLWKENLERLDLRYGKDPEKIKDELRTL